MTGDSPEALAGSRIVAKLLADNESLRRLAENPLLLTMLLVVKHGAGRLPPDRVSLYGRAVEVLLNTWNIKGHDPLNPKEAVPQLAFVAFQLMREGKQTATEKELLILLEEAREKVPQIGRYAKDSPQEFLKRVELRSSLLLEAGRQADGNGTVPFYQFRHLTFQEYLAAVAAVEGHYIDYNKADTVLRLLQSHLLAEEWKEIIPMSAVLAKKQAEPLIEALVESGNQLRQKLEANQDFGSAEWLAHIKTPAPVARLLQCLVEEAEATPATLTAALQLIALFVSFLQEDCWALSRGPYGEELLHQTWLLYASRQWSRATRLMYNYARWAAHRHEDIYGFTESGVLELRRLLESGLAEEVGRGLFTSAGLLLDSDQTGWHADSLLWSKMQRHLFQEDRSLVAATIWAWFAVYDNGQSLQTSPVILDRLLSVWLTTSDKELHNLAAYALSRHLGMPRESWKPTLTQPIVQQVGCVTANKHGGADVQFLAAFVVAFHAQNVWSDETLVLRPP